MAENPANRSAKAVNNPQGPVINHLQRSEEALAHIERVAG
jgi:hypothetical protein